MEPQGGRIRPVETSLRTARCRATLLAAVVASVAVAAPAVAQPPAGPTATVAAPQPMPLPDLPLIPYGPNRPVQSTAFQPSASLDAPAPTPAAPGDAAGTPRPQAAGVNRPVFMTLTAPKPQPQPPPQSKGMLARFGDSITGLFKRTPPPRPVSTASNGAAAPAWQWHGYGATQPSGSTAAPGNPAPSMLAPPMPQSSAPPQPAPAEVAPETAPTPAARVAYTPPPPARDPWKPSAGVPVAAVTDYPAYRW